MEGGNGTGGNETSNMSLPEDTLEIYVDTDENSRTGFRIGGIGAEYLVLMSGKVGSVKKMRVYKWEYGKWITENMKIKYAKNTNSMEVGINLRGNVYFRLVNFEGLWERINLNEKESKIKKEVHPTYVGNYNSTALFTRFEGTTNITEDWIYNQTTPSIVSNGSALFVAFDAGYADPNTTEPISIGFAVSNDNGNTWKAYSFSQDWGYKNITGSKPVILSNGYGDVFIFFENHTSGSYFEYLVHYHTNGSYSNGAPVWYISYISNWSWWSSVYSISASGMGA